MHWNCVQYFELFSLNKSIVDRWKYIFTWNVWMTIKFQSSNCSVRKWIEWHSQFKASNPSFFVDSTYFNFVVYGFIFFFFSLLLLFCYGVHFISSFSFILSSSISLCSCIFHYPLTTKSYISVVSVCQQLCAV